MPLGWNEKGIKHFKVKVTLSLLPINPGGGGGSNPCAVKIPVENPHHADIVNLIKGIS